MKDQSKNPVVWTLRFNVLVFATIFLCGTIFLANYVHNQEKARIKKNLDNMHQVLSVDLGLKLLLLEAENKGIYSQYAPTPIKDFSNQEDNLYLRFDYVSPVAVSLMLDDHCVINKIDSFDFDFSALAPPFDKYNLIRINYSGPGYVMHSYFTLHINTKGTFFAKDATPSKIFLKSFVCSKTSK